MTLSKNRFFKYFIEAKEELQKVTWPTRKETIRYTILVIAFSLAMAVYFGVADFVSQLGLEKLIEFSDVSATGPAQAPATETPGTIDVGDIEVSGENTESVTIEETPADEASAEDSAE